MQYHTEEECSTTKEELKDGDTISITSEISRMSFEPVGYSVDQSISLNRKITRYKQELLVNQSMRIN